MCKEEKVDDVTHHFIECSGLNIFGMYLKIGGIELQHILFN